MKPELEQTAKMKVIKLVAMSFVICCYAVVAGSAVFAVACAAMH